MNRKRSKALLASVILSTIYSLILISFIVYYSGDSLVNENDGARIVSLLFGIVAIPHMFLVVIGTVFNLFAYLKNRRGFELTTIILYLISLIIFPIGVLFVLPSFIFSIIGYFNIKKLNGETYTG
ncbi:hypothetical protein [Clostridium sp.]|uniref:hypothetical protein n=1 Tax=Clostridium sp. TaxID=1506 RepID=UPI00262AADC3|nr:hypothetical protein [Clostridium sp.]